MLADVLAGGEGMCDANAVLERAWKGNQESSLVQRVYRTAKECVVGVVCGSRNVFAREEILCAAVEHPAAAILGLARTTPRACA